MTKYRSINLGNTPSNKWWIIIIGWVYLHTLHYFDFTLYNPTIGGWIQKLIAIAIILYLLIQNIDTKYAYSKLYISGFIWIPMLSFVPCWLEHGQTFLQSFNAYLPIFILLLYFILHNKRIKENEIIQLLTLFAVIRTAILLIEQFTYPHYYFAFRPEVEMDDGSFKSIEIRSGILRYYISDTYLSMFLIFYWGQKVFEKFNWKHFIIFAWGIFGLWLDQTRQFMLVGYGSFLIILLLSQNKKINKLTTYIIVAIAILIIAINFDSLFGDLNERTSKEMSKDNIRLLAYKYFLNDYWGGPLSVLFGNGLAGESQYGKEISFLSQEMKLFRSDVGIVGFLNQYGIVSVLFFFWFYISLVRKNWKYMDAYIKMFLLATLLNIPLVIFFVNNLNWYVYMAFMMYLMDISIRKNKLKIILLHKNEYLKTYKEQIYTK